MTDLPGGPQHWMGYLLTASTAHVVRRSILRRSPIFQLYPQPTGSPYSPKPRKSYPLTSWTFSRTSDRAQRALANLPRVTTSDITDRTTPSLDIAAMTCRAWTIPENGSINWKRTDGFDTDLVNGDPHSEMTPSGSPPPEHFGLY